MSKEQLQINNAELNGNNTELTDILQTLNDSLIDLSGDTVTAETLAEGATAHDANGNEVTGVMPTTTVLYTEQNITDEQKEQARENIGAVGCNVPMMFSINEKGGLRITYNDGN